ncbi:MAG: YggT family protein [Candidatus Latescibacteria bacterium]|nr:YggT family protein [Candidatus Latescibacterota bacterium]
MKELAVIAFVGILEGLSLAVRACAAALGILLVARSLAEKLLPVTVSTYLSPLIRYTEVFVMPIRRLLPGSVTVRGSDYTPLLSALLLLFMGYGVAEVIGIVRASIGG